MSDLRQRIADIDARLGELYRERRTIMEQFADESGPAVLPPRTRRTETQRKVERCPRCGDVLPRETQQGDS